MLLPNINGFSAFLSSLKKFLCIAIRVQFLWFGRRIFLPTYDVTKESKNERKLLPLYYLEVNLLTCTGKPSGSSCLFFNVLNI